MPPGLSQVPGQAQWALMEKRGTHQGKLMKPQVVAWELSKRLRDDAIASCDSVTIAVWWARQIPVKAGQMYSLSGNLATMAPGLPYSIGGQVAYPERQLVAFVGDGGFSMGMADFATAVKYRLPIKVAIINNTGLCLQVFTGRRSSCRYHLWKPLVNLFILLGY